MEHIRSHVTVFGLALSQLVVRKKTEGTKLNPKKCKNYTLKFTIEAA